MIFDLWNLRDPIIFEKKNSQFMILINPEKSKVSQIELPGSIIFVVSITNEVVKKNPRANSLTLMVKSFLSSWLWKYNLKSDTIHMNFISNKFSLLLFSAYSECKGERGRETRKYTLSWHWCYDHLYDIGIKLISIENIWYILRDGKG